MSAAATRRATPRVIQAMPLPSVDRADRRRRAAGGLAAVGFVLAIALLNGLVPRVADAISAVLP
ncbi:MAG TPA: hypothetical protein VEW95_09350 [Candidatus Limnocylindrales bacterium]|nr:hypothetical protein [Candidatus Limnocylindrales bacterium]